MPKPDKEKSERRIAQVNKTDVQKKEFALLFTTFLGFEKGKKKNEKVKDQ